MKRSCTNIYNRATSSALKICCNF